VEFTKGKVKPTTALKGTASKDQRKGDSLKKAFSRTEASFSV